MALAAGVGLCVTLGVVISQAGRPMPVMAAVEVRLVVPVKKQAQAAFEPVILQEESWVSSDWEKDDHLAPIRGNVIEGVRVAEAKPAAPNAEPKRDDAVAIRTVALTDKSNAYASDPNIRWFNARPVRPAKTMWMTVTGYTPDEQSCGDSADGLTATMHSVNTNAMRMVAADTSVLPYGSMVSVPGYDDASIVPVLDCGGAIKGAKLDLMFATNKEAMAWGKQRVLVTVWEYADGKPAEDPRKLR